MNATVKPKGRHVKSVQPSAQTTAGRPAIYRTKSLKWQKGSGSFRGVEVAVVSEDQVSGLKAMFIKMPARKNVGRKPEIHYHSLTTHTVILQGSVSSLVNGEPVVGRPGDYFRAPAGWVHGDSTGDPVANPGDPVIMFMVIEGAPRAAEFETVIV